MHYIDDVTGPQHHHYLNTSVKISKNYQCPKNCGTIHPHFVYYNSHTDGMVIDKSLLGEKIKKKKSQRKK